MLVFFEELFGYVFAGVEWCVIACISVGPIEAYHACPPDKSILVIFAKLSTLSPNLRPWPLRRESLVLHITAILPSLTDDDDDYYDALLLNLFPFPSVLQSFLSLSGDVQVALALPLLLRSFSLYGIRARRVYTDLDLQLRISNFWIWIWTRRPECCNLLAVYNV